MSERVSTHRATLAHVERTDARLLLYVYE